MPSTSAPHRDDSASSIRLAFAALVLAMLPAVLDQTILATALPTIAADLGRLTDVAWLVTAYVVAATASTPLWGKLGDRHGHKRVLQIALAWFVTASALCGLAQDITQLVLLRALQGLAAGGLMTLAMAAVGDLVAPRERGRYQGYIAATFAAATALGPLAGGLLVDHADWRWVFYINLPLGAAAMLVLGARLPARPTDRPERPLDAVGAALLAGATAGLMLVCVWGGDRYDWGSATILGLAAGTLALAAGLVVRERRAADPVVPLSLLRTRPVAVASAALFLTTAALFAVTVFVPLFLQVAAGASPTEAGLLLVPMAVGTTISTMLSGRSIARTGSYKRFPVIGLGLMAIALAALGAVAGERSVALTGAGLAVFGLGFGLVTQVLIVAVQNSVDRRQLGVATATTGFFRALGGAVGAAALGALFRATAGTTPSGAHAPGVGHADAATASAIVDGVQTVLLAAAPLALVALAVVLLLLPELPLRSGPATRPGPPAGPPTQEGGRDRVASAARSSAGA